MKNLNPTIQSISAAAILVVTLGTVWHNAVIAPLVAQQVKHERDFEKLTNSSERNYRELAESVGAIEIHQAKVGVNLENLARSIERLAKQLERQNNYPPLVQQHREPDFDE